MKRQHVMVGFGAPAWQPNVGAVRDSGAWDVAGMLRSETHTCIGQIQICKFPCSEWDRRLAVQGSPMHPRP